MSASQWRQYKRCETCGASRGCVCRDDDDKPKKPCAGRGRMSLSEARTHERLDAVTVDRDRIRAENRRLHRELREANKRIHRVFCDIRAAVDAAERDR